MIHILTEISVPLIAAIFILARPQIFTKKDLSAVDNINAKKKLRNIGILLLIVSLMLGLTNYEKYHQEEVITTSELIQKIVQQGNEQYPKSLFKNYFHPSIRTETDFLT